MDNNLSYQERLEEWLLECFDESVINNKEERSYRFLEESLELVQSSNMTKEEALKLVDYVYSRPKGEISQEVGGVMTTLGALCIVYEIDMLQLAEIELDRVWHNIDEIRAKQKSKPTPIK